VNEVIELANGQGTIRFVPAYSSDFMPMDDVFV
jgi:hypothetical protein